MEEYIGLDVSKEETSFCVMDKAGDILSSGKALSNPNALFGFKRNLRHSTHLGFWGTHIDEPPSSPPMKSAISTPSLSSI